ncbi:MAG: EAL domain-containing protein [Acidocella sp.]|nr:EAL domain-containing protein [Acidocella sp.]
MYHQNGSILNILTYAEAVQAEDGSVSEVRGTSQDITPFRKIEAALYDSEDHYRNMVELHPQIPWTAAPDGQVLEAGPKWYELTGLTPASTLPFGWIDAVVPEDRERAMAAWNRSLNELVPLDNEFRIMRRDGGVGWFRTRAVPRRNASGAVIRWYGMLDDVTDRHTAEDARRAYEGLALRVLETTSDGVVVFNRGDRVTFANSKALSFLQLAEPVIGARATDVLTGKNRPLYDYLQRYKHTQAQPIDFEFETTSEDVWLDVKMSGGESDVAMFMRDVSENHRVKKQELYAARHDLLTGTLNRAAFFAEIAASMRNSGIDHIVQFLCLNIDYFKEINNQHGHQTGDAVLRVIASRLMILLGDDGFICRLGGDEFIIGRVGDNAAASVDDFVASIFSCISNLIEIESKVFSISVSMGIAEDDVLNANIDRIYAQADLALSEAKKYAKGGYLWFRPEMETRLKYFKTIHNDLRLALERHELKLVFQPIFRASDGVLAGAEALLRWHHPKGSISPAEFIPVAEESGLICDIGAWVLETACEAAKHWPSALPVSVNVSVRQFELSDICSVVRRALSRSGLAPHRLKLEMTESVLIGREAYNIQRLEALREIGVKIVLDDFGTGYSSLSYLESFRFDFIKIDKSFVAKINGPGEKHPVLEAIVAMTSAMDLPTTVEGVETEPQLAYIRDLGCDYVQGFLLGRPGDVEALLGHAARTGYC